MDLTIIILGITSVTLVILFVVFKLIGSRRKHNYEQDMNFLQSCVWYFVVDKHNYYKINKMFESIEYNNLDPPRTARLRQEFKTKYSKFIPKEENILENVSAN